MVATPSETLLLIIVSLRPFSDGINERPPLHCSYRLRSRMTFLGDPTGLLSVLSVTLV